MRIIDLFFLLIFSTPDLHTPEAAALSLSPHLEQTEIYLPLRQVNSYKIYLQLKLNVIEITYLLLALINQFSLTVYIYNNQLHGH